VVILVERYLLPELAKNGFEVEVELALWMNHNCIQATRVNDLRPDEDYGWRNIKIDFVPEHIELSMETVFDAIAEAKTARLPTSR
jgi:hypothetical protein